MVNRRAEYTVTEIARIAGAKPRSVQHWAASGILLPSPQTDRQGTGTARRFEGDEVVIACLMQPLLERQISIGEMLGIAFVIRDQLLTRGPARRALLGQIIRGERQAWFVYFPEQDEPMAFIVPEEAHESFNNVFEKMEASPIAFVIDLTTALKGLRSEL